MSTSPSVYASCYYMLWLCDHAASAGQSDLVGLLLCCHGNRGHSREKNTITSIGHLLPVSECMCIHIRIISILHYCNNCRVVSKLYVLFLCLSVVIFLLAQSVFLLANERSTQCHSPQRAFHSAVGFCSSLFLFKHILWDLCSLNSHEN